MCPRDESEVLSLGDKHPHSQGHLARSILVFEAGSLIEPGDDLLAISSGQCVPGFLAPVPSAEVTGMQVHAQLFM